MSDIDPFTQLALEHPRTLFLFYGYRDPDGSVGGDYFKQAYSLSEALADLNTNAGVHGGPYLVRDAFAAVEDGEVTIHVQVMPVEEALRQFEDEDEDGLGGPE